MDCFLAPSAFLRDRVVAGGLPADRVHVQPNPAVAATPPRPRPTGPLVIVYASRLVAEKGVDTLLEAAAQLPAGVRVRLLRSDTRTSVVGGPQ